MHPFSLDERAKRKLLGLNGPEVALPKWCSIALVSNPLTLLSILDYSASKTTQTATALSTTVPDQQIKPTHQTPKIPARAPISNSPGRARRRRWRRRGSPWRPSSTPASSPPPKRWSVPLDLPPLPSPPHGLPFTPLSNL